MEASTHRKRYVCQSQEVSSTSRPHAFSRFVFSVLDKMYRHFASLGRRGKYEPVVLVLGAGAFEEALALAYWQSTTAFTESGLPTVAFVGKEIDAVSFNICNKIRTACDKDDTMPPCK